MRRTLIPGAALAVAVGLLIILGSVFELEVESVALFGAAIGAAIALIADRSLPVRLGALAAGFVLAWVGYAIRAALLPDTSTGRAVAAVVIVALCLVVAIATRDRVPLWALLLGTAAMTGAYEHTYVAAPPELMATSIATASAMLLSVAVGLFAATLADLPGRSDAPRRRYVAPKQDTPAGDASADDARPLRLDEMMEPKK